VRRASSLDTVFCAELVATTYQHIDPGLVGNVQRILVSELAGRSTYLRRDKPSEAGVEKKPEQTEPVGAVSFVRVPENIGRKYGAVSGDRNPIHLHALSAKAFGFPRAIAHGMWLKARTLASLGGRLPDAYTVEVAFKTPVLLPSALAIATERHGDGWILDVRAARSGKPHLIGTVATAAIAPA